MKYLKEGVAHIAGWCSTYVQRTDTEAKRSGADHSSGVVLVARTTSRLHR
jgi:hypothetical protein